MDFGWELLIFMLASPFAGVGLWFFIRRNRKEYKVLKKTIKSGQWTQDFNYVFAGRIKDKLDKFILKSEKKHIKKKNKLELKEIKKGNKNG